MSEIFEAYITADSDDVGIGNPANQISRGILRFGTDTRLLNMIAGLRWLNITVPKNATINSAYVVFKAATYGIGATTPCNVTIKGEASDNPSIFSTFANWLTRIFVDHTVPWNNIELWVASTLYQSPELKSIIQDIVNREGWVSGNALALYFANNGSSGATSYRTVNDYSDGGVFALLHIEYTVPIQNTLTCATGVFTLTGKPVTFARTIFSRRSVFMYIIWEFFKRKGKL